ncbi:MAG: NfeD family protein [Planctomycetota bacterium]|nr:NfeD family protein [Planctomycetota bacterium]
MVSVGDWGRAESVLRPAGKVRFGDQTVDVVADGSFIQPDEQVKVVEISGNRILVVKA